jgi:hypothetical protein
MTLWYLSERFSVCRGLRFGRSETPRILVIERGNAIAELVSEEEEYVRII